MKLLSTVAYRNVDWWKIWATIKNNDKNCLFACCGGSNLSNKEVAIVTSLVEEQNQAKGKRNFATTSKIRDKLEACFSVKVDHFSQEWQVVLDHYIFSPLAGGDCGFDKDTIVYIQKQLALQLVHKTNRDYNAADEGCNGLRDNFLILIDDLSMYGPLLLVNTML